MTGQELVSALRESYLDDNVAPYLWSDTELLRNLNYAEVQACRRADLIVDGTTGNDTGTSVWSLGTGGTRGTGGVQPLCSLTLIPDQATYVLSRKIRRVKRVQLASMVFPLIGPVTYEEMDTFLQGWFGTNGTVGTAGSGGYPTYFLNEPGNTITFIKAPSVADTARLTVVRLPLNTFSLATSPEIEEEHHDGLLDWAAHLAYMKDDSDALNLVLAKTHEDNFTRRFGPLPDAYSERIRKTLSMKQRMRPRAFGS